MKKNNRKEAEVKQEVKDVTIEELAKRGAQEMLRKALEAEVDGYLEREKHKRSRVCRGYRNGYGKQRHLSFCGGTISVKVPRVSDIPAAQAPFEPAVVQRYQRRSPMLDKQFRDLYREGLATRDFEPCFRLLPGETATLSPSTISRLTKEYQKDFEEFLKEWSFSTGYAFFEKQGPFDGPRKSRSPIDGVGVKIRARAPHRQASSSPPTGGTERSPYDENHIDG